MTACAAGTPDVPAWVDALPAIVGAITRSEDVPRETAVRNADGEPLRDRWVPLFEPRPNAPLGHAPPR